MSTEQRRYEPGEPVVRFGGDNAQTVVCGPDKGGRYVTLDAWGRYQLPQAAELRPLPKRHTSAGVVWEECGPVRQVPPGQATQVVLSNDRLWFLGPQQGAYGIPLRAVALEQEAGRG